MSPDSRSRDAFIWLKDLRRDLAYGVRALARTRGFTAVALLTLALGIGAVTVIYSVLRNVVLEPFPYSRADRLVNVLLKDATGRIIRGPYFAAPEYLDYQEQAQVFEDVVATSRQGVHWVHDTGAEALTIAWMTPNGFDFLGVKPLIGRAFTDADAAPGATPVGVMNYRTWMTHFGGDAGSSVRLNDAGSQRSAMFHSNRGGITPITVRASPLRFIVRPSTLGSPPKCFIHVR